MLRSSSLTQVMKQKYTSNNRKWKQTKRGNGNWKCWELPAFENSPSRRRQLQLVNSAANEPGKHVPNVHVTKYFIFVAINATKSQYFGSTHNKT